MFGFKKKEEKPISTQFALKGVVFEFNEGKYRIKVYLITPDGRVTEMNNYDDFDTASAAETRLDAMMKEIQATIGSKLGDIKVTGEITYRKGIPVPKAI